MPVIDDLLANNTRYVEKFDRGDLPLPPGLRLAVVACMDARLDTHSLLGIGGRRRPRHTERRWRGDRRCDPFTDDLATTAGHDVDHAHPPHGLRNADLS